MPICTHGLPHGCSSSWPRTCVSVSYFAEAVKGCAKGGDVGLGITRDEHRAIVVRDGTGFGCMTMPMEDARRADQRPEVANDVDAGGAAIHVPEVAAAA